MAVSKDISLGEDVACTVPVYAAASSVYMSRLPMYSYRYREQSDSRAFKIIQYYQLICVLEGLIKSVRMKYRIYLSKQTNMHFLPDLYFW